MNTTAPVISGTAQQGDTLSVSDGAWSGSPNGFSYAWQDCDANGANCAPISGAGKNTYALQAGDVGDTIEASVTATNTGGSATATTNATAVVTAAPPPAPVNTTAPVISGTAQQGDTLSVSNGAWSGSPNGFSYAWQDCDANGANCAPISGAGKNTYTLQAGDVGDTIEASVTATNTGGSATATTNATAVVTAAPPPAPVNTTAPVISGTAQQGDTLSVSNGAWSGSPNGFSYAWQDCDANGANCVPISGAGKNTYTLQAGDVGDTIEASVTATNAGGSATATTNATAVVTAAPPPAPVNTTAPVISGTAQQGDTLSVSNGAWSGSPNGFSYAWQDCDANGANCVPISGAGKNTYTLQAGDVGDTIEASVTATNAGGSATATTNATAVVTAAPPPVTSQFPLQVSANGRYLETAQGSPWLMVGDSPQALIGNNSEATADSYFADRVEHGFNAVWVNLLCADYTFCNSSGTQAVSGHAPFTSGSSPADYSFGNAECGNCNSSYFSAAHAIIADAEADGIEVLLDPIETSGCSGGWMTTLENNGDGTTSTSTEDYKYGQYLGTEFGDLKNIIWLSGNDFQCIGTAADRNDALAVAEGIANTDPAALQTLESNECNGDSCEGSSSLVDTTGGATGFSAAQLNLSYTYAPAYAEDRAAYAQTPTEPVFLGESNYDGEDLGGTDGCLMARNCRLQEWWTATSGATGDIYGSYYTDAIGCGCSHGGVTLPANGFNSADLDSDVVTQFGYVTSLLESLDWQDLVPDTANDVVTSGIGTCPTTGSITSVTCVTTASDYDGSAGSATEAISYLPDPSSFASPVVDLADFAGPVTAEWYDPADGAFRSIAGSPFSNSGTHTFTPTTNNSAGDKDWVLLLQS